MRSKPVGSLKEKSNAHSNRNFREECAHGDDLTMKETDKKSTMLADFFAPFRHAADGLVAAARHERSMRIHILAAVLATALGAWIGLAPWEWVAVAFCCSSVIALECANTAIEALVDLASPEIHPIAKKAKDCAAGAVLAAATGAAAVGTMIFLPKLVALAQCAS